jgi:hypothetical protein
MSVTPAELGKNEDKDAEPTAAGTASDELVLVTEQEVIFATAAAAGVPPATRQWVNPVHLLATGVRSLLAWSRPDPWPAKRHYPARSRSYYDSSIDGRERGRL